MVTCHTLPEIFEEFKIEVSGQLALSLLIGLPTRNPTIWNYYIWIITYFNLEYLISNDIQVFLFIVKFNFWMSQVWKFCNLCLILLFRCFQYLRFKKCNRRCSQFICIYSVLYSTIRKKKFNILNLSLFNLKIAAEKFSKQKVHKACLYFRLTNVKFFNVEF